MMSEQRTSERITEEVTSWPGVVAGPGRRGEFAFKVGSREIGHLHGDHAAHFGFPKAVWKELLRRGASTTIRYSPAAQASERGGSRPTTTSTT
jgi:Luciferase